MPRNAVTPAFITVLTVDMTSMDGYGEQVKELSVDATDIKRVERVFDRRGHSKETLDRADFGPETRERFAERTVEYLELKLYSAKPDDFPLHVHGTLGEMNQLVKEACERANPTRELIAAIKELTAELRWATARSASPLERVFDRIASGAAPST
jgi:hypothetical protein